MPSEDERLAKVSRRIRRAAGLRQIDLQTPRFITQELEAGRAGQLRVDQVRAHFTGLGAKAQLTVWWNGAALDRLVDEAHSELVEAAASRLSRFGFRLRTEHTFNEFGERGSIDIFGGHEAMRAVFVGEAKSEWGSIEETLRRQDLKVRLAPKLAAEAFGWRPRSLANVLILPNNTYCRRIADRHSASLNGYAARARDIRAWLCRPVHSIGGIWFVSDAGLVRRDIAERADSSTSRRTG